MKLSLKKKKMFSSVSLSIAKIPHEEIRDEVSALYK